MKGLLNLTDKEKLPEDFPQKFMARVPPVEDGEEEKDFVKSQVVVCNSRCIRWNYLFCFAFDLTTLFGQFTDVTEYRG